MALENLLNYLISMVFIQIISMFQKQFKDPGQILDAKLKFGFDYTRTIDDMLATEINTYTKLN